MRKKKQPKKRQKLFCPGCQERVLRIVRVGLTPLVTYHEWSDKTQDYELVDAPAEACEQCGEAALKRKA
jgi:YgiT-type zinc finger domain-containing protein